LGDKVAILIKIASEEKMVQEAIAAYRAAREGKVRAEYAMDLLYRVGTTVPCGGYLLSIITSHILVGGFVSDKIIDVELLLRQRQLLLEAKLWLTQLQIELKKLEIEELRLEL